MTFRRPTLASLTALAEAELRNRLGAGPFLRRSVFAVLARVMAGLAHSANGFLEYAVRQILPDQADAEFLERHGSLRGVTRKPATFATGAAALTGNTDAAVPEGTVLQRADGARYITRAPATIPGPEGVLVDIEAEAPGAAANAPSGTAVTLSSPVAGVAAEGTLSLVEGGQDAETDDELRARVLEVWRQQPHAGTEADYVRWALEVPGVTRAYAYGRTPTVGQVAVYVVADGAADGPAPSLALREEVQTYIDERRPVAARVSVLAPAVTPLAFSIEVSPSTATVRARVEQALADFLEAEARPGGILQASRIREAISATVGEESHRIVAPAGDIAIAPGELVVLGAVSWL
ncbi:MAG: baseplate J/gp47 family protein [Planctomycetota bacterium]